MRAIPRILATVLAMMLCMTPLAAADQGQDGENDGPSVVPVSKIHGIPAGALLGDWFIQNLALPATASPFGGGANLCLDLGRHGRVLSPAGGIVENNNIEMTCTIEAGRPVLLAATSAECSTAEAAPFFGRTEEEQRACALNVFSSLFIVTKIAVSVDGARPVDIHQPEFFAISPQRRVVFPEGPVFDAKPGPATFVAVAWIAEIRGMRIGDHTVVETPTVVDQSVATFTVHFKVVDGGHHDS